MLPGSMQDAIKNRAAARKKQEFKDPYVKPKMSKEDFLAEKARGPASVAAMGGGGGGAAVDLSPVLQAQNQMQRHLQQLTEQVQRWWRCAWDYF